LVINMFWRKITKCKVGREVVLLSTESVREFKRAKGYATKEPGTLKWIENNFKTGDVIYDIGANIGQYSLYPAKLLKGDCKVYAFEPEALNFAKLNYNIKLNDLSKSVLAYPIALINENKLDKLYLKRFGYGEAFSAFGVAKDNLNKDFEPVHIEGSIGLTLDSLVFDYGLEQPNHIKIDVDGIERKVVEGGDRVMADNRLKSVLLETTRSEGWEERERWFKDFFKERNMALSDYEASGRITQNLIFKRQ